MLVFFGGAKRISKIEQKTKERLVFQVCVISFSCAKATNQERQNPKLRRFLKVTFTETWICNDFPIIPNAGLMVIYHNTPP